MGKDSAADFMNSHELIHILKTGGEEFVGDVRFCEHILLHPVEI